MASLLGRVLRNCFALLVAVALLTAGPLQAVPFAALVMDARTGEVLYEDNANTRLHPASLTKMMTLYIVFQEVEAGNISLDTKVTVSDYAAAQPPSRLGLKPGQKISIRYLIRAAAIKSANDAAAALGDVISGDHEAFAKRMTATARELGMYNTTFKNANGLTAEGHLSTAYDMTILGRHLFYDFPEYYGIFSRRTEDAGVATVTNTNSRFLDSYEGADGIKTGYTSPAGFNLTASAQRDGKHIIATVFGGSSSADRNARMAELMDLGFKKAPASATEIPPAPAKMPDEALLAALESGIDEIDAEGGAGKTIRVSGEVLTSPRPKPRPILPSVPEEVALAMAAGIDGALAEATAEPAAEGTLEFQAEAMAAAETTVETPDDTALAALDPVDAIPPVADAPPSDAPATPDPIAVAAIDPGLMPEGVSDTVDLASAAPELVVTDPGPEVTRAEDPDLLLAGLSEVESVAGETNAEPPKVEIAAAMVMAPPPKRMDPIFDAVETKDDPTDAPQEEIVVVMSTSGGEGHFGVNVGEYPSRQDAERALLKTALAESATLNEGLRKATQSGDLWRASFMGLTRDQAELACRRLAARAVPCELVGG